MSWTALRMIVFLTVVALLSSVSRSAPALEYSVRLDAGKVERTNVPVKIVLRESNTQANTRPVQLEEAKSVQVTDGSGKSIPAQLAQPGLLNDGLGSNSHVVREVHLILPSLKRSGEIALSIITSSDAPKEGGFAWKDTPGKQTELADGDRPVLRYMYEAVDNSTPERRAETYKVFHHLFNPAGTRLVTKGPGGLYPHHRGLFFGFNRISYGDNQRVDTWHCGSRADLSHVEFVSQEAGSVMGRHTVKIDWHGPGDKRFAQELREMTVYRVPKGHLVEFASRLESRAGDVRLDGDPQHAGFQFRAAQAVAEGDQKSTYYLRPDGKGQPGETRNWGGRNPDPRTVNLPWNALSFVIDEARYTAVYLDHPNNPKEARYSERTYGRFGSYFEYDLTEEKPLVLNYRLWLQEGEMSVDEATALSADFVDPPIGR